MYTTMSPATETCTLTARERKRGKRLDTVLEKRPFPAATTCTIHAAALLVNRTPRTIYNLLSLHANRFDPPMYQRRRDGRLIRLLSEHDLATLRAMFTVYVKRKIVDRP